MFEKLGDFFNRMKKPEIKELTSKDAAKERLHLVLMQDRANVSVEFLELMKQEIIDVIKKYIVIDESAIDVRLTSQEKDDGTNGEPTLYASIPIINIKNDTKAEKINDGTLTYKHGELEKADKSTLQNVEDVATSNETELNETTEEPAIVIELAEAENKESQEKTSIEPIVEVAHNENANEVEAEDASDIMEIVEENNNEEIGSQEKATEETVDSVVTPATEERKEDDASEVINETEIDTVEPVLDFVEDDEDDDDVTFDDLLKKAEEEEKTEKAQTTKKKKTVKQKKR